MLKLREDYKKQANFFHHSVVEEVFLVSFRKRMGYNIVEMIRRYEHELYCR